MTFLRTISRWVVRQGYLPGRPTTPDQLDLTHRRPPQPLMAGIGPTSSVPVAQSQLDAGRLNPASSTSSPGTEPAIERMLRRLLRVSTPEQAIAELVALVHDLGGRMVAADRNDAEALPVDLSFGFLSTPMLPAAGHGTDARRALEAYLPGCVEDVRAVVSRLEQSSRTAHDAAVDPLTGLLNRRAAGPAMRGAAKGDAFVMLDLDHFKQLNDEHGHEAGDAVLRAFGTTLRNSLREADTSGRFGGEEFLAVLPATSVQAATAVVQRLANSWRQHRPMAVTFSAGIAAVDSRGHEAALAAADAALYRAKAAGRDRIEVASPFTAASG